jgi:hypothetical protein
VRTCASRSLVSGIAAAGLVLAATSMAQAQRGGRFPGGGGFAASLGDPNDYYTPPDFHGNPEYDGRFTFARIKYRGYDHWSRTEGPGWSHDYPDADTHLMNIVKEVTNMRPFVERGSVSGGAIVALDDQLLLKYPVAYLSEPGGWHPVESEVAGMKRYLQKGGFIIFDDFNRYDFQNLAVQMNRAFPELEWKQLTGREPIFGSFFSIDVKKIEQQCAANRRSCYRGIPKYWALYEQNDPRKHMLVLANVDADIGEFWQWSGSGFAPMDVSNEAYKLGVNWIVYALTH